MSVYQRRYDDLKFLVEQAELENIRFHELSAKLLDEAPVSDSESAEAQIDLRYQTRTGDTDFGIRVAVKVTTDAGEAQAIVAADYKVASENIPDEELIKLFATEVAMMAVFPYIREGIQSATTRVFGTPVTLPLLQRGEVRNESDERN